MGAPPLAAFGLTLKLGQQTILSDVSLSLQKGSLTALVGANGAGKSTLLQLLQGHLKPTLGEVTCEGLPIHRCRERVVLMPQRGRIDWSFPITVREFVELGTMHPGSGSCCTHEAALQRVGLTELSGRRLDALSGGQQQRALLARSLVQSSRVLLLDEPCAAIDPPSREHLLREMRLLADAGQTLLVSSHDWGNALDQYDRVIVLDKRILADGPPGQVRQLLGSQLDLGPHCHV